MSKYIVLDSRVGKYYGDDGWVTKINNAKRFTTIPLIYNGLKVLEVKIDGKLEVVSVG
jgi:hypothetical protein